MAVGKLYMIDISPSVRSVLLTEKALGIQFDYVVVNLSLGEHLKPEFVKLNPQHTVPFYVDRDGTSISDSHAINAFLVGKYGKTDTLYPRDLVLRAIVDQRLHFNTGSVACINRDATIAVRSGADHVSEQLVADANAVYALLNKFLAGHNWIAGDDTTIADLNLIATVTTLDVIVPIDREKHPKVRWWLKRCEALPYYAANAEGLAKFKGFFEATLAKNKQH